MIAHIEIEELGTAKMSTLQVEVDYDFEPAEEAVMYYPDGSGYPGAPEYFEITGCRVTGLNDTSRETSVDWFKLLDSLAFNLLKKNEEEYRDKILDNYYDDYSDDRDDDEDYYKHDPRYDNERMW